MSCELPALTCHPSRFTVYVFSRLTRRRLRRRDGGRALRRADEANLSALLLQVEVARAPVDPREQPEREEDAERAESHHDELALPRQVHAAVQALDGRHPVPAVERLHGEDG